MCVTSVFFWRRKDWRNWFSWKAKIDARHPLLGKWLVLLRYTQKIERVAMRLISGGRVTYVVFTLWWDIHLHGHFQKYNYVEKNCGSKRVYSHWWVVQKIWRSKKFQKNVALIKQVWSLLRDIWGVRLRKRMFIFKFIYSLKAYIIAQSMHRVTSGLFC